MRKKRVKKMKKIDDILKSSGVYKVVETASDGAMFDYRIGSRRYEIIASNGDGWDHVSVVPLGQSYPPTWQAMSKIKDLCFDDDEAVMELHPAKSQYVNLVKNCLHLWRPQKQEIPLPPLEFV